MALKQLLYLYPLCSHFSLLPLPPDLNTTSTCPAQHASRVAVLGLCSLQLYPCHCPFSLLYLAVNPAAAWIQLPTHGRARHLLAVPTLQPGGSWGGGKQGKAETVQTQFTALFQLLALTWVQGKPALHRCATKASWPTLD